MEANLLGARPAAATLRQPGHDDACELPSAAPRRQRDEKIEPPRAGGLGRETHRAGGLAVVAGVALAQVLWIGLLTYAVYWIATRLPL
jgi:hypothetical protein